jgi:hypothetical protein
MADEFARRGKRSIARGVLRLEIFSNSFADAVEFLHENLLVSSQVPVVRLLAEDCG